MLKLFTFRCKPSKNKKGMTGAFTTTIFILCYVIILSCNVMGGYLEKIDFPNLKFGKSMLQLNYLKNRKRGAN